MLKWYSKLKERLRIRRMKLAYEHVAKIVNVKFGMQVTYQVIEGKDKGHTFSEFYTSFADTGSARKELIKWVFTEGGRRE